MLLVEIKRRIEEVPDPVRYPEECQERIEQLLGIMLDMDVDKEFTVKVKLRDPHAVRGGDDARFYAKARIGTPDIALVRIHHKNHYEGEGLVVPITWNEKRDKCYIDFELLAQKYDWVVSEYRGKVGKNGTTYPSKEMKIQREKNETS